MKRRTKVFISAAALAVVAAVGTGAAVAGGTNGAAIPDDSTPSIAGPDLDHASSVALTYTGQGRVTETEVGDEDSYYEVEVTLDDGSQVDVQLDEQFSVVTSMRDHDTKGDVGG